MDIETGPVEFVGDIKPSIIIPVTPNPEPDNGKIDWKCYERIGCPVARFSDAKAFCEEANDHRHGVIDINFMDTHKIGRNDLAVGMELVCVTLFGISKCSVKSIDGTSAYAANESYVFPLSFSEEEGAWINSSCINAKTIKSMTLK